MSFIFTDMFLDYASNLGPCSPYMIWCFLRSTGLELWLADSTNGWLNLSSPLHIKQELQGRSACWWINLINPFTYVKVFKVVLVRSQFLHFQKESWFYGSCSLQSVFFCIKRFAGKQHHSAQNGSPCEA
jgi:hypothetical protein